MNVKDEGGAQGAETKKVMPSPRAMWTEYELAHAALQAAIRSKDVAGADAARIWIANIQVEQRQAELLLREHLCERMARGQMSKGTEGQMSRSAEVRA